MSLTEDLDEFYSQEEVAVIREPLCFRHKLGIGEAAYNTLRVRENLKTLVESLGVGAVASSTMASSVVATTFFTGSGGWLASLGFASAAVTPVGWILGAGMVVGGGYLGTVKLLEKPKDNGFIVIPKHINTPLDLLASTLLDIYIPLGLKFSWLDGHSCELEQKAMYSYLVGEWGYCETFLEKNIETYKNIAEQIDIVDTIENFVTLADGNRDCDLEIMKNHIVAYLSVIIEADGKVSESELESLALVKDIFNKANDKSLFLVAVKKARNNINEATSKAGQLFIGAGESISCSTKNIGAKIGGAVNKTGMKFEIKPRTRTDDSDVISSELIIEPLPKDRGLDSKMSASNLISRVKIRLKKRSASKK